MPHPVETSARRRRWVLTKGVSLSWRCWDDNEYVVYSTASGDTHLINEVTAEVLRSLERSDLQFSDLARNVAESLGTEPNGQFEDYIARLLAYLDQVGLVEPVP